MPATGTKDRMAKITRGEIGQFLAAKRIAVIGVSRKPKEYSRLLFQELLKHGYDVIPVNPAATEIDGKVCFGSVADISPAPERAVIILPEEKTERAVLDCAEAGIRDMWLYPISSNAPAIHLAEQKGLRVIAGYCLLMFLPRPSLVHKLHGGILKLVGAYPRSLILLSILLASLLLVPVSAGPNAMGATPSPAAPLMALLDRFTASDVPVLGPGENNIAPRKWDKPIPAGLPGNGLAQHPMLYIGEGYNKMFVINKGKIIWTYSTGAAAEYDDVWMLSNGNILFTRMQYVADVTPKKQIIWRYDAPKGLRDSRLPADRPGQGAVHPERPAAQADGRQHQDQGRRGRARPARRRAPTQDRPRPIPPRALHRAGTYLVPFLASARSRAWARLSNTTRTSRRSGSTRSRLPGPPSASRTATR